MKDIKTITSMRPFTMEDAPAVVDLFNACSQALYGRDEFELNQFTTELTAPGMNITEMVRVLVDTEGTIIGYVDVWDTISPHVVKYVWAVLHPDHWDDQQYHDMLAWGEDLARKRIPLAPEGSRVVMSQGASSKDLRRKNALESYGYQLVRHFFRMEISFDETPQQPILPAGITIAPIDLEFELTDALIALEEGFRDHWGHVDQPIEEVLANWKHKMEHDQNFDPSLWFLAKSGSQIAGVCYCTPKTVEDPLKGWVNLLCVRKPWRRMGLGKALLLNAFNVFYQRGKKSAGLGVDSNSLTNATRLYEKAGMIVTEQFDVYEIDLREGIDLATP